VVTGVELPPPEPALEPLVWVTTGVECEPEVGTEVEAPLEAVVTGGDPEYEEEDPEPVEEAPVVALPP
jgi:hypothetical protein